MEQSQRELPAVRTVGTFEGMLQGQASYLLYDARDYPGEYTDGTNRLIMDLVNGRNFADLTEEERRDIDTAAVRFMTRGRIDEKRRGEAVTTPGPAQKKPRESRRAAAASKDVESLRATPKGDDGLPAFWWLR